MGIVHGQMYVCKIGTFVDDTGATQTLYTNFAAVAYRRGNGNDCDFDGRYLTETAYTRQDNGTVTGLITEYKLPAFMNHSHMENVLESFKRDFQKA